MRTDTNVADGDTPLRRCGDNGQFDRNLFVLDRTRLPTVSCSPHTGIAPATSASRKGKSRFG